MNAYQKSLLAKAVLEKIQVYNRWLAAFEVADAVGFREMKGQTEAYWSKPVPTPTRVLAVLETLVARGMVEKERIDRVTKYRMAEWWRGM